MNSAWKLWLLRGFHFLLALSVPLVLTVMLSCMKATAQKEDLGPAFTADQINAAIARVQANSTLNNLAVGQYLVFDTTRRVANGDDTIDLGGRRIDVIDRQDTTDQARFTSRITTSTRLPNGTFETTVAEDALWLDKVAAAAATAVTLRPANGSPVLNAASLVHLNDDPTTDGTTPTISYYHLQESDGVIPAPPTVAAKPNCGGLSNCQIPLHYIHFDIVTWQDSQNYTKVTIDFGFSTLTPLIPVGLDFAQLSGLLISNCQASYLAVDNEQVYVRDCESLDDYQN
jgi:hypothetical protein